MKATLARIFLCPFGRHGVAKRFERHPVPDSHNIDLAREVLRCTNCGECLASGAWQYIGRPLDKWGGEA